MEEENDIIKFLSGDMDPTDRVAFLQRLKTDAKLKREVEHSRRIKNITDEKTRAFSGKVRQVIHKNRKNNSSRILWVAASVAALMVALVYVWPTTPTPLPQLANEYLAPYPDIVASRSTEVVIVNLTAYNQGQYELAAQVLKKQWEDNQMPLVGLYLVVSYLHLDKPSEALQVLAQASAKESAFGEDMRWYKSLALMKANKREEAEQILQAMVQTNTSYAEQAQEILETMGD